MIPCRFLRNFSSLVRLPNRRIAERGLEWRDLIGVVLWLDRVYCQAVGEARSEWLPVRRTQLRLDPSTRTFASFLGSGPGSQDDKRPKSEIRNPKSDDSLSPELRVVARFELLAASARTWIVAPNLLPVDLIEVVWLTVP